MDSMTWPNGAKCAVMVSFNVDGAASWISDNEKIWAMPKTFSMGSYGPWRGLPRILKGLKNRNIRGSFFVPGWIAENWPAEFASIIQDGHEVAHRGYLIESPWDLTVDEQKEMFARSTEVFNRLGAPKARGYRAPNGNMRAETGTILAEAGYSYSSSLRGDDRPYEWTVDGNPIGLVEIPVHTELDDSPQFVFSFNPPMPRGQDRIGITETVFKNWEREFRGYYQSGLCFVLTLDPQFMGKPGRARRLMAFLDYIQSHEDVWFATGAEISDWYRKLARSR
jgi:peptidoglycan/xylan/chitin deacetylase (PgdA/CDA1 family)